MNRPYWLKENPSLFHIQTFPLTVNGKSFSKGIFFISKGNTLETKDLKDFSLADTAFSFNRLKEKSVYKVTKDFPLGQL